MQVKEFMRSDLPFETDHFVAGPIWLAASAREMFPSGSGPYSLSEVWVLPADGRGPKVR